MNDNNKPDKGTLVLVRDSAGPIGEYYENVGIDSHYVYKSGSVPTIFRKGEERDVVIMSTIDSGEIFDFLMKHEPYTSNG